LIDFAGKPVETQIRVFFSESISPLRVDAVCWDPENRLLFCPLFSLPPACISGRLPYVTTIGDDSSGCIPCVDLCPALGVSGGWSDGLSAAAAAALDHSDGWTGWNFRGCDGQR
jgi:hypothetical protein